MARRTLSLCVVGVLALATSTRSRAQSDPYAKLIGTWSIDSMTGAGEGPLPKSETVAFSRSKPILRVTAISDEGQGPATTVFDCSSARRGTSRDLGDGQSARCTLHPTADSILYTLVIRKKGRITGTEHGRLVVSKSGSVLRDEYDETVGSGPPMHRRHIYSKTS